MSNIIDKILLSGVTYTLSGTSSGSTNAVELTQAQYDALVSGGTVDPSTFYIITDATPVDVSNYWTSAQTQSAINQATSGKVNTSSVVTAVTSGSTDNEIPTAKAVYDAIPTGGTGGGKAISAGTNISVTTGETADTVSCTLPIYINNNYPYSIILPYELNFRGSCDSNFCIVEGAKGGIGAASNSSHKEGHYCNIGNYAVASHVEGYYCKVKNNSKYSHAEGYYTETNNESEHASGRYNNSVLASYTFGDSGNTLFSVGNGTADNARHNAFEIRQNGDIYITSGGTDIKLQDNLGGGGSITVDPTLDSGSTNPVANSAITEALDSKVNISTQQNITGNKTFIGSSDTNKKPIILKQASDSHKIGFVCQNSASTNNELATFEFRPDTYTDSSSVKHPLLYLGHYRNKNTANAGVVQTMVGFRQYDQANLAAYHYLMPLPNEAKTPFSLTTTFKNYFAPLGFKVDSGGTMVTTDNTGVVDLSSYIGGTGGGMSSGEVQTMIDESISGKADSSAVTEQISEAVSGKIDTSAVTSSMTSSSTDAQVPSAKCVYDQLGGLKLVKLTQSAYDALSPNYDSNTLYIIKD